MNNGNPHKKTSQDLTENELRKIIKAKKIHYEIFRIS